MQKLIVFNHVSLDGYFVDANNSMMWAKMGSADPEWNAFVAENASGDASLVFGRVTYELMIDTGRRRWRRSTTQWWPSV